MANGPVGPAMAGPIIEPGYFFFYYFFYFNFLSAGPIIEPVIFIFAFFKIQSRHKRFLCSFGPSRNR